MTDRTTYYYGEILRDTDILNQGRYPMIADSKIAEAILGTSTVVDGFVLVPTTPVASLNLVLSAGQIYQQENLEATPWSSLAADTAHNIVKQGVLLDTTTLTFTPPTTTGYSQSFLVEAQYADLDTGSALLPYYNAAQPSVPFNGPGNSGTQQNTVRKGIVAIQIKAGNAATTGSQTTPAPDAGWVGLYVVTVANGATTITSGNITQYSNAPFLPVKLPGVPFGVQAGGWIYSVDQSGAAGVIVANLAPIPTSQPDGMTIAVKVANTAAGADVINVNGVGNASIKKRAGGTPAAGDWVTGDIITLRKSGSVWQLNGLVPSDFNGTIYTRTRLFAAATYYVATTGSDSNPGTSAAPWATIQHAWNVIQQTLDLNGFQVVVNVADGTYTGGTVGSSSNAYATGLLASGGVTGASPGTSTAGAPVVFIGSSNAIINITNGSCFVAINGASIEIHGFTLLASGTTGGQGSGLFAANLGIIQFQGTTFGNCGIAGIRAGSNGGIICNGNFVIAGSGQALFYAFAGGCIYLNGPVITVSAASACTYSVATAWAQGNGTIYATSATWPGSLVSGSRYAVALSGAINTNGSGTNYFPGNSAGTNDGTGAYG